MTFKLQDDSESLSFSRTLENLIKLMLPCVTTKVTFAYSALKLMSNFLLILLVFHSFVPAFKYKGCLSVCSSLSCAPHIPGGT